MLSETWDLHEEKKGSQAWLDSRVLPFGGRRGNTCGVFFHTESSKLLIFEATDALQTGRKALESDVLFPAWLIGCNMLLKLTAPD